MQTGVKVAAAAQINVMSNTSFECVIVGITVNEYIHITKLH